MGAVKTITKQATFWRTISSVLFISTVISSQAALPKALSVLGWGMGYDGIYVDIFDNGLYYKQGVLYPDPPLTIVNPLGMGWSTIGGFYGGFYQETPSASPAADVTWRYSYSDMGYPPPRVYVGEEPDQKKPDESKANTKEPINTISGNMVHEETDFTIPCPGISLSFVRSYNSGMTYTNGSLGPRWSHSFEWSVVHTSKVSEVLGAMDCLVVKTGDGRSFELLQYGTDQMWRAYREIDWIAWPATNGGYRLDIPPASQWRFDSNGVLTSICDLWGNSLTLTYINDFPSNRLAGVDHSGGRYLSFSYTGDRLTGVDTPSANLYARYAYNSAGELTNATLHTSAAAQPTAYSYDGNNHILTQRVNAAGEAFAYAYATNGSGEVTSLCIGMELEDDYYKHTVSYHTNDSYSEVTYCRGETNQVFQNHYSPSMQKITRIDGPGSTNLFTAFTYEPMYLDVTEELTEDNTISPAEYFRTVRIYDSHHNVLAESAGYCGTVTNTRYFTWHEVYQTPTSITDPEGNTTEIDYTNGLPTAVRLLDGEATAAENRLSYSTSGLLAAVTNANGNGTRFYYDGSGNRTSAIPQAGPAVGYEWSSLGVLEKILLPSDEQDTNDPPNMIPRVTEFTSDEQGLVSRIVYPDAAYENFQYDAMRRLTNRIDIAGRSMGITYAPAGHPSSVTRYLTAGGSNQAVTTSMAYDQQFTAMVIHDPLDRIVEAYALDLQGRPVAVTNLEGQTMSICYGLGGFIRSLNRFDGSIISNSYDTAGRLIEIRYPDSTNRFGYLQNDLLSTAANEQGTVSNAYNGANRLTSSTCIAPNGTVAYGAFPAGQVSNIVSAAGTVTYALDGADRVESMLTPAGDFAFTFNENNGLVSGIVCTNNGLNAAFSYDGMDRVTAIVWRDVSNRVIRSFGYDFNAAGLIDGVTREDGSQFEYVFDSLDRLTSETQWDGADVAIFDESIAYDLAGNRTAKARDGLNVSYSLGDGNRLAGWTVTDTNLGAQCDVMGAASEAIGTGEIFGQLWVSNMTAVKPVAWGTNFMTLDFPVGLGTQRIVAAICDVAGNTTYVTSTVFMTVVTNAAYGCSDAGCLTSVVYRGTDYLRTLNLAWDGQYRLTEARTNGAVAERFGYDALGRRAWTWDGVATNWHVYDGVQVVADVDSTGGLVRTYVWGPGIDNLLALTVHTGTTAVTYYTIKDHLGSVHALVSDSGAVEESYRFDAWGRVLGVYDETGSPISESQIGNRYLWQGREYSWQTGLYYFRARWYDPVTGRWLSNDPIGITGGLNQYVFCANNPVNFRDPLGLCADYSYNGPELRQRHWYDDVSSYLRRTGINAVDYFGAPWINTYHAASAYYDNPTVNNACYLAQAYLPVVIMAGLAAPAQGASSPSFFEGANYTPKVLRQMKGGVGEFHSFPESVTAFENAGTVRSITGGDGVVRQVLEIPGSYGSGGNGVFRFIKNADGTINERLFVPNSP